MPSCCEDSGEPPSPRPTRRECDTPFNPKQTSFVRVYAAVSLMSLQRLPVYAFFFSTTCVWQVVNGVIKDPVLGTKIDIETGDVVEWCPSFLGKLLSPILGPEPENAGVNVFKVRFQTPRCVSWVCLRSSDQCRFWLFSVGDLHKFNPSLEIPNLSWLSK